MSWSVSAVGRAPAVLSSIAAQFETGGKCTEPEESVRQAASTLLNACLSAQDPTAVVKVAASGSQSYSDYGNKTGLHNSLNILVEPLWGFRE